MKELTAQQVSQMLVQISDSIIANEELLCKLDSHVGDGDHGVTVARGFTAVKSKVFENENYGIGALLELTGDTLSETMGGAIGPIFGSIFSAMGEEAGDITEVSTACMAAMLRAGLDNVMLIGGAAPGDRTLVDALAPAVAALEQDAQADVSLADALQHAATAAHEGALATKDMVAKKGRAKFLQDKSIGFQDAGATSMSIVLAAMADYVNA